MTKFKLPGDLYTYQVEDSQKMLNGHNTLNFSEMGVGKTPETLEVIERGDFKHALILCPNSLRLEWQRQIEDWVGEGMTAISSPDCYGRMGPLVYAYRDGIKYMVLNYESLRNKNHLEILSLMPIDIIIMDEIHKLRNPKTKQVRGAWEFVNGKPDTKVIGLSGSPIMNYPNDLYIPLSIVDKDEFSRSMAGYNQFMYHYGLWADGRYGTYMYGSRNMPELKERTSPYIIRRTKKEVLPFLPEKYYRRVQLEMPPEQKKLYDQMEQELKILLDTGEPLWSTNVLSTLTRLRQINLDPKIVGVSCPSAKTDFIMDTIESTNEKIVIFSCFEKYIHWLHLLLEAQEVSHVVITGMVPPNERSGIVKKFQEDESIKLCLGTVQAMGEGITLTAASNVIMADRWWNEPTNQQAQDRLHRIGQKSAVQVILPVCTKSADAILDGILQRKDEMSQQYYQESQVRQIITEEIRR